MTTSTKATQATQTQTQATVNPFLAALASETAKLEAKQITAINKQLDKAVEDNRLLADAACQQLGIELSEKATEFYGLMVSSASTDNIAAASGDKLAAAVVEMVTAYYSGNKESLQPIVDASNMWITTKAKGEVKTANIPNNLRLLVSRKSQAHAEGDDDNQLADYKLVISTEKVGDTKEKRLVIAEKPLKTPAKKTNAQKVFEAITKLDVIDRDELIRLVATDANLIDQFGTLGAMAAIKDSKVTKDTLAQLEARRSAAVEKEDLLQDVFEVASESKLTQADVVADLRDELAENETALTSKRVEIEETKKSLKRARKAERKAELLEDVQVLEEQLSDLLGDNETITTTLNKQASKLENLIKTLNKSEEDYTNQANLVVSIGKQVSDARAQLAH